MNIRVLFLQIGDFGKIFRFRRNIPILDKYSFFGEIFRFWPNIRFLDKYSIFRQIFDFWTNIRLVKNVLLLFKFADCYISTISFDMCECIRFFIISLHQNTLL